MSGSIISGDLQINTECNTTGGTYVFANCTTAVTCTLANTWYTYKFNSEINDSLNEYNPSTGVWVAASSGLYAIIAGVRHSEGSGRYIFEATGTANVMRSDHHCGVAGVSDCVLIVDEIVVEAGDTIGFRCQCSTAGQTFGDTAQGSYLSIRRIQ